MHIPEWGLIRVNGNTEIASTGAKLGPCGNKWIICEDPSNLCKHHVWKRSSKHYSTLCYFFRWWSETTIFSHFVATKGPKFGQHAPKRINSEHSSHKFELDCVNTFSDNGQKPPFSFILWSLEGQISDNGRKPPYSVILWPLEGQNLANVAQKRISSENSPNKRTQQVWIGLCEYFFR